MKSRLKNFLTFLIGWPFSLISLYFIAKTFLPKFREIQHILNQLNFYLLLLGIVCFLAFYFLRSLVWHKILKLLNYRLNYIDSTYLWATSEFKRYIPGNIWSFLGRSFLFSEKGVSKKHLANAMIVEVQIIFISCLLVSFLGLPYLTDYVFDWLSKIPYLKLLGYFLVFLIIGLYSKPNFLLKIIPAKFKKWVEYILPVFKPIEILYLLFISSLALLFFGLGYYFTTSSITFLDPKLIIVLSGFFVFSLLVGLLSVITPTGLGVREGSITLGLSKIIPLGIAGFVSIFCRIILVTTEILFILLSYLFYKPLRKFFLQIQAFIAKHPYLTIITILITIFNIYFSTASILKHDNFYTGRFDLGNMDQTVWNTKHGRIFQFTNPDGTNQTSRLSFHADFILVLLAPLYFIWEDPKILLITQTFIVSLGAVFVYLISKHVLINELKSKHNFSGFFSIAFAFSYLMNPGLQWAILYDFHAVTFATTFLLAAYFYLLKRNYQLFILFAILAGITKEHVWIPVSLMGILIALQNSKIEINKLKTKINITQKKYFILGLSTFVVSISFFVFLLLYAIPKSAQSDQHFALSYFKAGQSSPTDLLKDIFFSPDKTINKLTEESRVLYLKQLFGALGYLPLLTPIYLFFPIADFALNLLSDKVELHQIYYQYSAVITPFLYISAIIGSAWLLKKVRRLTPFIIAIYVIAAVLTSGFYTGPMPWTKRANVGMFTNPQKNKEYIKDKIKQIDPKYSVSASNNIGAHFAHREKLYTLPIAYNQADYIVFLITDNTDKKEKELVDKLWNNPNYSVIWEKDGFITFRKIHLEE